MHRLLRYLLLQLLVVILASGPLFAQSDSDWPRWRGKEMNAQSTATGLLQDWKTKQPKLVYNVDGFGAGYSSVSIADGKIFTIGNFDNGQSVVAADQETGKVIWKTALTSSAPKHSYPGSRCTPTYDDGSLYVVTSDGQIACLDATKGGIHWKKSFKEEFGGKMMSGWGFAESPLVDGDVVVCTPGGKEAAIVALNKKNGDVIWEAAIPDFGSENEHGDPLKEGAGYSSVMISNGGGVKQYVQLLGIGVVGVRAADGKFLWGAQRAANKTANISTPIIHGDYVFYSTAYGAGAELIELSSDGGGGVNAESVYHLGPDILENHHGGMILLDGYIYCGHKQNSGFPVCIELETGEVQWGGDFRPVSNGSASVLYADGHLIYRYQRDGKLALVEANPDKYVLKGTFEPEFQKDQSWAHPVIAGKRLYLREQERLMCYDLSN